MTFNAGIEAAALLPCPFCGSRDAFVERSDFSSSYVMCNKCSARGPVSLQDGDDEETPGEQSAIRSWNTRPSSSAPVEQREAVALDIADEFILVCEAAARQAKRTGNTFVLDRQRVANLIQAKLTRYTLPGSSRDEALEQIVAVCDDNAADNCGHQLALRFVRNVAASALKSGGAK